MPTTCTSICQAGSALLLLKIGLKTHKRTTSTLEKEARKKVKHTKEEEEGKTPETPLKGKMARK
jgi:hypothetical protein